MEEDTHGHTHAVCAGCSRRAKQPVPTAVQRARADMGSHSCAALSHLPAPFGELLTHSQADQSPQRWTVVSRNAHQVAAREQHPHSRTKVPRVVPRATQGAIWGRAFSRPGLARPKPSLPAAPALDDLIHACAQRSPLLLSPHPLQAVAANPVLGPFPST